MSNLLIDLSQILLASITKNVDSDEKIIKYICLNSIKSIVKQFKQYENVVLCCDSRNYWRKEIYPYYKANRKENRQKSKLNWDIIFTVLNQLKEDLASYFPYRIVEVDGAEADDIIAVLSQYFTDDTLIISSDHDYKQLHILPTIKQYNPILDIYVKCHDAERELKEKIIRGDKGDNIPSIMSADDVFALKKRQSPISKKKLETWLEADDLKNVLTEDQYRNYNRNDILINFAHIPEKIKTDILEEYHNCIPNSRKKLYEYLIKNKMTNFLSDIQDF